MIRDGIVRRNSASGLIHNGILNYSVLNVKTADFHQISVILPVVGDKLGNDGDRFGTVNGKRIVRTPEVLVSQPVRGEICSVLIANAVITVARVVVAARDRILAPLLTRSGARMRREGLGVHVGLPDIELHAAGAVFAFAGIGVVAGRLPVFAVGLSVDELDVVRALGVAVAGSVFRSGVVSGVAHSAVFVHLDEVKGAVQAAPEFVIIDGERELAIEQVEHFVAEKNKF